MSIKEKVLRGAVAFCLVYSAVRAVEFILDHVPPYKVGQCLQPTREGLELLSARVDKNHIFEAYSDMDLYYEGYKFETIKVTFADERESASKFLKINCLQKGQ